MSLALKRVPSHYNHELYKMTEASEVYTGDGATLEPKGTTYEPEPGAEVVVSKIKGTDDHIPMLDLDIEAHLLPSSTPGHSHLYIDKPMPWKTYKRLMKELARAGILEEGYYKASASKGFSALRLRGVKKR